jgi:hypothetical protein
MSKLLAKDEKESLNLKKCPKELKSYMLNFGIILS